MQPDPTDPTADIDPSRPLFQMTVHRQDDGTIYVQPEHNGIHPIVLMMVHLGSACHLANAAQSAQLASELGRMYNLFYDRAVQLGLVQHYPDRAFHINKPPETPNATPQETPN